MALCRNPWITYSQDIAPCGKCPECHTNHKQLWTNRNILESYGHVQKSFVTLTYDNYHMPFNSKGNPTLVKEHLQTFFKNLRSKGYKVRYYAVGEYGTSGERGINPHYHILLYGAGKAQEEAISDSWRLPAGRGKRGELAGFCYIGDITEQSIGYVTGYVHKKTYKNKKLWDELGIVHEYPTMSLRPAIGSAAIPKLVDFFKKNPDYLTEYGDVPYSILHGSRSLPLGDYIREKIREGLNLSHDKELYYDEQTGEILEKKIWHGKEAAKAQKRAELQLLQENSPESPAYDPKLPEGAQVSIKQFYSYKNSQRAKQFDVKQRLAYDSHKL